MENYEKSSGPRSQESLRWGGSSVFANLLICETFPAFMPSLFHSGFSAVALVPIIRLRIHRAPLFFAPFASFCSKNDSSPSAPHRSEGLIKMKSKANFKTRVTLLTTNYLYQY
jgi:hypothetical protein